MMGVLERIRGRQDNRELIQRLLLKIKDEGRLMFVLAS